MKYAILIFVVLGMYLPAQAEDVSPQSATVVISATQYSQMKIKINQQAFQLDEIKAKHYTLRDKIKRYCITVMEKYPNYSFFVNEIMKILEGNE